MAGPLDGYAPSAGGPLAGYTPSSGGAEGNWLTKSASTASATPTGVGAMLPSWMTTPLTADEGLIPAVRDLGLSSADYLALNQLKRVVPTSVGDLIVQAHQNLGYADPVVGAASYLMPGIGPAKYLKAGTEALGMSGLGVGLGGKVAEGALAGGISGFDPSAPISSTLEGAGGGAVLGGAAHGIGKVANVAVNSALNSAPTSAAANSKVGQLLLQAAGASAPGTAADAVAATRAASDNAFATLRKTQVQSVPADNAFDQVLSGLSPSQQTGMSKGFQDQITSIRNVINDQGVAGNQISGDDLHSWARQINDAASTKIDGGIANDISTRLRGVVGAQGGAGAWDAANATFKQAKMAENLQGWQTDLAKRGMSPGNEPLAQQKYYTSADAQSQNEQPQIDQLDQLYNAGKLSTGGLSYTLGKIGGEGAEALGAAAGLGGAATLGLGAAAHLLKYPIAGVQNLYKRANLANELRQAYPTMTGRSVGYTAPNVGEAIKALMLSQGSHAGY